MMLQYITMSLICITLKNSNIQCLHCLGHLYMPFGEKYIQFLCVCLVRDLMAVEL